MEGGGGHLYDWLRARGYWLPPAHLSSGTEPPPAPTHLLLDGGRARVPDESHGAFLNAYAASLARCPGRRPCVVELRTPVFRMFLDLDTRFSGAAPAAAAVAGPLLRGVFARLSALLADAPDAPPPRALVCAASRAKDERDGTVKLGFHVVWPEVLVTAATALELRRRMVESLADVEPASLGLASDWDSVLDASVYRANGLRMPWSGKGRGDDRFYDLRWTLTPGGELEPVEAASVSALRDALRQLSVRTFSRDATLRLDAAGAAAAERPPEGDSLAPRSLAAYADVLPALAAALPAEFAGQKFTGLMATERCFMLRSTARFCFNVCREHCTSNVYFTLTRRGVCQRCYCRKDTTEGRKYGVCKDFVSEWWPVPASVVRAFFPPDEDAEDEEPASKPAGVAPMPSRAAKSYLRIEALMARSRPQLLAPAGKRRKAAAKA